MVPSRSFKPWTKSVGGKSGDTLFMGEYFSYISLDLPGKRFNVVTAEKRAKRDGVFHISIKSHGA